MYSRCLYATTKFIKNLNDIVDSNLQAFLHEHRFVKELGKFIGPARISGIKIPPEVFGALLDQRGQHVFLGGVADVANQLEGVQVDVVRVDVPVTIKTRLCCRR